MGGIRGAVPIILATFPLTAGIEKANIIFDIVFFVSVTSVLVQGTSIHLVAKWLKLDVPEHIMKKSTLDLEQTSRSKSVHKTLLLEEGAKWIGHSIVDIKLPNSIVITMIKREGKYFIADGSTLLKKGDQLTVLADSEADIESLEKENLGIPVPADQPS